MTKFGDQTQKVIQAVKTAVEDQAWDSGHVTGARLIEVLNEFQEKSLKKVDERLVQIRNEFSNHHDGGHGGERPQQPRREEQVGAVTTTVNTYSYKGRFFAVPEDFEFPKPKLREAIRFWLCGQTVSEDGKKKVKPFRKLSLDMLPTKSLKDNFKIHWKPIFAFLSEAAALPPMHETITNQHINEVYDRCVGHLKSTVSYCFQKKKNPENEWTIATWSLRTSRSSIEKKGTESDKAKLPEANNRNKARNKGLQRKRKESENPLYLRRQRKRQFARNEERNASQSTATVTTRTEHQHTNQTTLSTQAERTVIARENATFENSFPLLPLNERMQNLDQQTARDAQEEMLEAQQTQRRMRAVQGDAVAGDGTLLFTSRRIGTLAPNLGDNSKVARERYTNSLANQINNSPTRCPIPHCDDKKNMPTHPCRNCGAKVHNLCAQRERLCSDQNELSMYCSILCKQSKEG